MPMHQSSRRHFVAALGTFGLGTTLLPDLLDARMQETGASTVTAEMLSAALAVAGLSFTDEERAAMLKAVNTNLGRYETLRNLEIPNDVAPPFYFSPLVAGMTVDRQQRPLRWSSPRKLARPAHVEEVAFAPITHLAALLKARLITSVD